MSGTMSDHDDYADSPPNIWRSDKDESAFIRFLGHLNTIEFAAVGPYQAIRWLTLSGVVETTEVVRHCLTLFFTHINLQQCNLLKPFLIIDANSSTDLRFYKTWQTVPFSRV
jgi:hypothetical protein